MKYTLLSNNENYATDQFTFLKTNLRLNYKNSTRSALSYKAATRHTWLFKCKFLKYRTFSFSQKIRTLFFCPQTSCLTLSAPHIWFYLFYVDSLLFCAIANYLKSFAAQFKVSALGNVRRREPCGCWELRLCF